MTTGGQINISGLGDDRRLARPHDSRQPSTSRRTASTARTSSNAWPAISIRNACCIASFAASFSAEFELRRIRSARMSETARAAVEGDNAKRIFGLD